MTRVAPTAAPRREILSSDTPIKSLPPVEDDAERLEEAIQTVNELPPQSEMDKLAFMREPVTIVLNRGSEKYAPEFEQFGVNGKMVWVKTGVPTTLPRCYVEVIARSQPVDITTASGKIEDGSDRTHYNIINRRQRAGFSFSVLEDRNPKGAAWLSQIIRQG